MAGYTFDIVKVLNVNEGTVDKHDFNIAFSRQGDRLAVGFIDGSVKVYRTDTWDMEIKYDGVRNCLAMYSLVFTPDGRYLIAGRADEEIVIHDMEYKQPLRVIEVGDVLECIAITDDGKTMITGDDCRRVCTWDFSTGDLKKVLVGHGGFLNVAVPVDIDGTHIISACNKADLFLFNSSEHTQDTPILKYRTDMDWIESIVILSHGNKFLAGSIHCFVYLYAIDVPVAMRKFKGGSNGIYSMHLMPDDLTLFTAEGDNFIKVWRLDAEGESEWSRVVGDHGESEETGSIARSNDLLASSGDKNTIIIRRMARIEAKFAGKRI